MTKESHTQREVETMVAARYPDGRLQGLALDSARAVLSEAPARTQLEGTAQRYAAAVLALDEARAELTGAIIATDAPETKIAEWAGVTRMTVRKARGK
ncbi:hypothetical protein ACRTEC_16475 [Janibacter indicus]|mgnify:FL=1